MKKLKAKLIKKTSENRLYNIPVPVIGLTGGIATGKSTVAELFRKNNIPVIDADRLVKLIYQMPETKNFIQKNFPQVIAQDQIVFQKLREIAFSDADSKKKLEDYIYAHLPNEFKKAFQEFSNPTFIIYDVPLLFEKNLNKYVDFSVCIYAPRKTQIERLMLRDQSTHEMAETIINQQMDIEEKKNLADFIIYNTAGPLELETQVLQFIKDISH
jgi:dephospho-CoA kinase